MQLSEESYRARWLILVAVWLGVACALFYQAKTIHNYLSLAGQLGLRGAPEPSTPLKQIFPAFAADAQTWVRHALSLTEGDRFQLRNTDIDNAPYGREVHWNSAWAWTIAGAGWIYHLFTGAPLPTSIERATIWLTPCVLLALVVILSSWATRRAGVMAGVLVAVAMTCHDRIYEGFFPSYVDHHGLLTVAVLGLMLGAVMMGGGWWQARSTGRRPLLPDSAAAARQGAIFSAISGALGMWVTAASMIPPIVLVGSAGLLAVLIHGRKATANGAHFAPEIWRLWGRAGAAMSLFFYVLEYFPAHLGLRLEANHPLHAIAWLGGGELIAELTSRWLAPPEQRSARWSRLALPLLALSAAPLVVALGGPKVFIVIDPFLSRLHADYIQEFLPIWRVVQGASATTILQVLVVDNVPLLAALASLSFYRRDAPIILWFATLAGLLFNIMAWWESRWLLNASGVQVCLLLVLIGCWTASAKSVVRWLTALVLVAMLYVPGLVMRIRGANSDAVARRVAPRDGTNALYRDIAAALRANQPSGEITLLASPNGSTAIGYYGRFKTLGTLYWENRDGLKAAAAIFSAKPDSAAMALLRSHHVTHIAIVSDENFIQQYFELLHRGAPADQVKQGLGYKLLVDKNVPQWLEIIPYRVPDDLSALKIAVLLFKVNFEQTMPEATYHLALAQIALGSVDDAERTLDSVIAQAPGAFQAWLRKGELFASRHRWTDALDAFLKGISLAPVAERPALTILAGKLLYDQQQRALAIQIYRSAMRTQPTADAACYLAWILATSREDSLRNGPEALQLAEAAAKADPNSISYLMALAAALGETGRFGDAVVAADRALANSRLAKAPASANDMISQRLETLRSGKPLRY